MIGTTLALGLLLLGAERGLGDAPASAADRITLRDGSVVLGVVSATTPGPRGSVEFLVRRDWAEKALEVTREAMGSIDRRERPTGRGAAAEAARSMAARSRTRTSRPTIASCSGSIESWRGLPAGRRRDPF